MSEFAPSAEDIGTFVTEAARRHGFHRVGIVPITAPQTHHHYTSWLAAGNAATMDYLATDEHIEPRSNLRSLLPEAKSLIVVALAYHRGLPMADDKVRGRIARYAAGLDYHIAVRDRLYDLSRDVSQFVGRQVLVRPCVDSAPVLEREWAERSGLGFIGKNTMLIAPGLGSYVVLGEMLLDVEARVAEPTQRGKAHCGSCTACLEICPTKAFVDSYVLDARKCISYLTIEHRGVIERELRAPIGTWIFGCDLCQEACPYNATKSFPTNSLAPRDDEHLVPDLIRLVTFGANQLRNFVKRTALRRSPREQILRNVAIALGNHGDPRGFEALTLLLTHRHWLVRLHAAWALGRLAQVSAARQPALIAQCSGALTTQLAVEPEASVADEIRLAQAMIPLAS